MLPGLLRVHQIEKQLVLQDLAHAHTHMVCQRVQKSGVRDLLRLRQCAHLHELVHQPAVDLGHVKFEDFGVFLLKHADHQLLETAGQLLAVSVGKALDWLGCGGA
jgi:hypothetical protein